MLLLEALSLHAVAEADVFFGLVHMEILDYIGELEGVADLLDGNLDGELLWILMWNYGKDPRIG